MPLNFFQDVVRQAMDMGFADLVLTPINGDVFMDKGFLDKLRFIEAIQNGPGIQLYTNLIGTSRKALPEILALRQLRLLVISVYGHDLDAFRLITARGEEQFRRLQANLHIVEQVVRQHGRAELLSVCVRTERGWRLDDSQRRRPSAPACPTAGFGSAGQRLLFARRLGRANRRKGFGRHRHAADPW